MLPVLNRRPHALGRLARAAAGALLGALALGQGLVAPTAAAQGLLDGAVVQTEQVRAELLAHAPQGVAPGQPLWLGLRLAHQPGWHTYWKNPGDSGLATALQWTLPAGVGAGEIAWPAPRKFALGELANYGYEGTVLLPVPLTVEKSWSGPALDVQLQASWLACRKECIPQEGRFRLRLPAGGSSALYASEFEAAWRAAPREVPGGQGRIEPSAERLTVRVSGLPPAWSGQTLEFFPETPALIEPGAAWTQRWEGGRWTAEIPLSRLRAESPPEVPVVLALARADTARDPPAALRLTLPVAGTWPPLPEMGAAMAQQGLPPALERALQANGPRAPDGAAMVAKPASVASYAIALLGALLGGLILNLMPCVFPVLAIKVLGFAQHAHDRRAHLAAGLGYSAGVVLSFLVLGALLLALRAAGEQLGWGFQLQDPRVVAALAVLFTAIGLNLAGVFEFGTLLPASWAGARLRHPVADAGLSGVLAAVVASPCTAPFMGASVGLAIGLPAVQALGIFAAIGVGMALPYLLASAWPAVARALPRPGPWMLTLRQLLAFPMLATVVWLVWVLGQQSGVDGVAVLLLLLLTVAFAGWALGRPAGARAPWLLLAAALLAGLLAWGGSRLTDAANAANAESAASSPAQAVAPEASTAGAADAAGPAALATGAATAASAGRWQPWSPRAQQAALAAGQPVFVDYTAAWCVTCQFNKRAVLGNERVLAAARERGIALLRADWTRRDPAVTEALAALGRNGVPVYALYRPGQAPQLLSEVLDRDEVIAAFMAAAPSR